MQKYGPMPSEREIRKLHVNGINHLHRVFLLLFQIFSVRRTHSRHRRWRSWGLGGDPSTSILAGRKPAKIANMYMFALLANFTPNSGQIRIQVIKISLVVHDNFILPIWKTNSLNILGLFFFRSFIRIQVPEKSTTFY